MPIPLESKVTNVEEYGSENKRKRRDEVWIENLVHEKKCRRRDGAWLIEMEFELILIWEESGSWSRKQIAVRDFIYLLLFFK